MAARVPLNSLPAGTILLAGTALPAVGATAFVYTHGTQNAVTVYSAEVGVGTLSQPLTADSNGQLPGWVVAEQSLDIVATYHGVTANPMEVTPVVGADVASAQSDLRRSNVSTTIGPTERGVVLTTPGTVATLPSAPLPGLEYEVANESGGSVSAAAPGAGVIDFGGIAQANVVLTAQGEVRMFAYDPQTGTGNVDYKGN